LRVRVLDGDRRSFLAMLVLPWIGGCVTKAVGPPSLHWLLVAVQPTNISLMDQILAVRIDIRNLGASNAQLAGFRYRLQIGGEMLVAGEYGGFVDVAAGSVRTVTSRVSVPFAVLGKLLSARANLDGYRLEGSASHSMFPGGYPFADAGLLGDLNLNPTVKAQPGL
jgi:hypothetical protein